MGTGEELFCSREREHERATERILHKCFPVKAGRKLTVVTREGGGLDKVDVSLSMFTIQNAYGYDMRYGCAALSTSYARNSAGNHLSACA